jgi:hypothetical protein
VLRAQTAGLVLTASLVGAASGATPGLVGAASGATPGLVGPASGSKPGLVGAAYGPQASLVRAPSAAKPSVPSCALGSSAADLHGFAGPAVARAERRLSSPAARRAFAAGVAAYLYGLPPVSLRATVARFPRNLIVSVGQLVNPEVRTVVAPNVDTTYTVSQLDLSGGPLVIDVPDTAGRYYVLQLLDAYSNTFAYIGRRTTGTRAAAFAVVPPGFSGPLPAGVRRIESPTALVWLLGRTLVRDQADLPAVSALMRAYRATPLASWTAGQRASSIVLSAFPTGLAPIELPRGIDFYDLLGTALSENPPPGRDACALRAFAAAGIGPGRTPSTEAHGAVRAALEAAPRAGARLLGRAVRRANAYSRRRNNGWLVPLPYIGDYGRNYLGRAVIARFALGANTRAETVYPSAFTDSRGRPLSGRHRYRVRFPRRGLPPVGAFWSLTMYGRDGYLYPNPLERYAIGDRSKGLRRGRDGSLTLLLQNRPPARRDRANWLPAPTGRFRLIMRLYEPRRSALRGSWRPPPVLRR